ncbi:hypothetical protein BRD04_05420 [Halobacteriales archaeon QS_9_67_17]|nr:MAG: hypothetical protein BRD04_05420 [Halobacteriales archaeon QS_9_67_17]
MSVAGRTVSVKQFPHLLGVWTVVSAITVGMTLNRVLPWIIERSPLVFQALHYIIGPALLVAVGIYVERRSSKPWVVAIGTVFLLWGAMSFALGCPAGGCDVPDGYSYLQGIRLATDIGIAGPSLLISAKPEQCAFSCPYRIQLIPMAIAYAAFGYGLMNWNCTSQ